MQVLKQKTLEVVVLLSKFKNPSFEIKAFQNSCSTYSNQNSKGIKVDARKNQTRK